jgi:hypothetical protein
VRDLNAQLNIIGDGINVAQRVMSFAETGQLLVSRSFYEVVSCLSKDYESLFGYVGARTDKHVREHEVYVVGKDKRPPREAGPEAPKPSPSLRARLNAALSAPGPFGLRRITLVLAPLIFIAIVGAAARVQQQRDEQRAREEAVAALPVKPPVARPKPAVTGGEPVAAARPANGPTQVLLQIAPWGEVFVDGRSRGVSPPMRAVEVSPGHHSIEIRNSKFPPHVVRVDVRPGQEVRVRYRFGDSQGGKR